MNATGFGSRGIWIFDCKALAFYTVIFTIMCIIPVKIPQVYEIMVNIFSYTQF